MDDLRIRTEPTASTPWGGTSTHRPSTPRTSRSTLRPSTGYNNRMRSRTKGRWTRPTNTIPPPLPRRPRRAHTPTIQLMAAHIRRQRNAHTTLRRGSRPRSRAPSSSSPRSSGGRTANDGYRRSSGHPGSVDRRRWRMSRQVSTTSVRRIRTRRRVRGGRG